MSIFRKHQPVGRHEASTQPEHEKNFVEGYVPVHGDESKAERLAMRAYGDSDHDGRPDVPNVPFPG